MAAGYLRSRCGASGAIRDSIHVGSQGLNGASNSQAEGSMPNSVALASVRTFTLGASYSAPVVALHLPLITPNNDDPCQAVSVGPPY
jgi:hypothetical protein